MTRPRATKILGPFYFPQIPMSPAGIRDRRLTIIEEAEHDGLKGGYYSSPPSWLRWVVASENFARFPAASGLRSRSGYFGGVGCCGELDYQVRRNARKSFISSMSRNSSMGDGLKPKRR